MNNIIWELKSLLLQSGLYVIYLIVGVIVELSESVLARSIE